MSYLLWYLLYVPLLRPLLFPCLVCVICTIWPTGTDPISMFSLTSLLPASFCTLLSDLLVLTHCLYDFDYCLTPIKILILTTLCIWVLSSLPLTPQFLTLFLHNKCAPITDIKWLIIKMVETASVHVWPPLCLTTGVSLQRKSFSSWIYLGHELRWLRWIKTYENNYKLKKTITLTRASARVTYKAKTKVNKHDTRNETVNGCVKADKNNQ